MALNTLDALRLEPASIVTVGRIAVIRVTETG
jgi:hypothetical protein